MQFASIPYLLSLALAVIVYYSLPGARTRTVWLLLASYGFYYSLSARWTVVLALITLAGYVFGELLGRSREAVEVAADGQIAAGTVPSGMRWLLALSIALVGGTLVVFKYTDFAASLLNRGLMAVGNDARFSLLGLVLPVGISFWTFQTIAYLVDVARGKLKPERSLPRYALFIAFFAHVLAGPIARGSQLLPQLAHKNNFSYEKMRSGLLLMLWGFFKKLVVADTLGVLVNEVYTRPQDYSGAVVILAAVCFSIQIYCDFSGYTDTVRGSARLFGIELLPNFDRPYLSRSVSDMWRRWHMSLMGWLRDYIYIPLGGGRVPRWRKRLNVLAVFAFSGLWHGAGLTFIAWGLLNGAYVVLGEMLAPVRNRVAETIGLGDGIARHVVQTITTFALVTVSWVFFRATSLSTAFAVLGKLLDPGPAPLQSIAATQFALAPERLIVAGVAAAVVFAVEVISLRVDVPALLRRQALPVRWAAYQVGVLAVVVLGHYGANYSAADFAYFRF